ncbi:MAG: RIP metalloprotease RseP, partial [Bradymonadaceae bacterium]
MSFLYFIILIGVLIFVHEFGHFLFAKAFEVKVLRFSIGFGPPIVSFQKGETEYVVCWLPLGGYVQMYGHNFESMDHIDEEDKDRALMGKPVWQRSLITFAGPLFNFILPVVLFFFIGLGTAQTPPSVVGSVYPETPAAEAGLQPGDRIVAIEGERVRHFREVVDIVSERDGERKQIRVTPEKQTSTDFLGLRDQTRGMLGIHLGSPGGTIALDDPDGPAARAGLQNFDRILAVNGESVETFRAIQSKIRNSGGRHLELLVLH